MPDYQAMAADVVKAAQSFVTRAVAGITKRIDELSEMNAALDKRIAAVPAGKDGAPGTSAYQIACLAGFSGNEKEWLDSLRGKDAVPVDKEEVRQLIVGELGAEMVKIPRPKDGEPGSPGKDADPEIIRAEVATVFAALVDRYVDGVNAD